MKSIVSIVINKNSISFVEIMLFPSIALIQVLLYDS